MECVTARQWAREEFGGARLGDQRRTSRLVAMAATALTRPAGRVSGVFVHGAQREGAYDLLANPAVDSDAVIASMGEACARRCGAYPFVFVGVDGSSITITDHTGTKDVGAVGTYQAGARGLKVITAYAVSPSGVPLGCCAMQWWARARRRKARPSYERPTRQKETQHWLDAIDNSTARLAVQAPGTRAWFQLDREGDGWNKLEHLERSGGLFTVRSNRDRRVRTPRGHSTLRAFLGRQRVLGSYFLEVPGNHGRRERLANMTIRAAVVTLDLRDKATGRTWPRTLTAVWVRESRTTPHSEKPIEWLLLTNYVVDSLEAAKLVVFGYAQRWRIEDFHKTWKSGVCDVESTQLRARSNLIKWATLLAAVAARAERLKHLARKTPDEPASIELSAAEIEATILLKKGQKSRVEVVPDTMPTIAQATLWIAHLGGYTGKSSGGPPGSITIGRGLRDVQVAAAVIEALGKGRKKR
jgi:Transposase DNA-binding